MIFTKIAQSGREPAGPSLQDGSVNTPWEQRAKTLESFYDSARTW